MNRYASLKTGYLINSLASQNSGEDLNQTVVSAGEILTTQNSAVSIIMKMEDDPPKGVYPLEEIVEKLKNTYEDPAMVRGNKMKRNQGRQHSQCRRAKEKSNRLFNLHDVASS